MRGRGVRSKALGRLGLAFQDTKRLDSEELRFNVIKHMVRYQAELGRHADAFKMAGYIRDRRMQALTMLAMCCIASRLRSKPSEASATCVLTTRTASSSSFLLSADAAAASSAPNLAATSARHELGACRGALS